jgi:peptidoglycan/LPS O-acetylase OafA/YrhL
MIAADPTPPLEPNTAAGPLQHGYVHEENRLRFVQLDGLRAMALLMVFLLHHSLLRSGWAGVDIFFVLSGFLITGILRRESEHPAFWTTFYAKRAARILPPLLLLFSAVLLIHRPFLAGSVGYLLFGGNVLQLTRYRIPELSPLWSLAIEEHFYFVWPFAVRCLRCYTLLRLCIAIVILSPIVRAIGTVVCRHWGGANTGWDNPVFLLTPFRIDGLAAGSALALLLEGNRRPSLLVHWSGFGTLASAATFLGMELVDSSFRRTTDNLLFNSIGYSLVVVASFCLLSHLVLHPHSWLARCLGSRPMVFLGAISYGFYIYQEAVMAGVRSIARPGVSLHLLCVPDFLVSALVASVSFFAIEKRVMRAAKTWLQKAAETYHSSSLKPLAKLELPDMEMERN